MGGMAPFTRKWNPNAQPSATQSVTMITSTELDTENLQPSQNERVASITSVNVSTGTLSLMPNLEQASGPNFHGDVLSKELRPTAVNHSKVYGQTLFQECPFCGKFPSEIAKENLDRESLEMYEALEKHVGDHFVSVSFIRLPVKSGEELAGEWNDTQLEAKRNDSSDHELDGKRWHL
ncbi:hypothetical protein V8C43DRAFT_310826 [Trichoderma afarasin]